MRVKFVRRCGTLFMMMVMIRVASAQGPARQVVVTSAIPNASGDALDITGENFRLVPFVTLNLLPLTIERVDTNRIQVAAPLKLMPAGPYLLTVSYGAAPEDNGSFQVVLGEKTPESTTTGADARNIPSKGPGGSADSSSAPPFSPAPSETAAKVGDRSITIADVDREWQRTDPASYLSLTRQLYEQRRRVVDTMVADELLAREAAARGLSVDALLKEEIPKHVIASPESAVVSLYQSLGDLTRGSTLEQMRPALRAWLERMTEPEIAKMNYVEELMKVSTRADVFLAPPRIKIDRAAQDATLGPDDAPIEIVAFGDFQSAEYARFAQAFGKVRDTFGDRVRLVFKNLPMMGPDSATAAEGARCAASQAKFWPYHDALVSQPGATDRTRLSQTAKSVGLASAAFEACLDRGEFRDTAQQAVAEAARYGITSTPSFVVNGRLAPDPPPFLPPFDFFKRIIEDELQSLRAPAPRR